MAGRMRDWPRTLQRASYRGVQFWVEKDSLETGRRLVVHEFPKGDTPYVEDLGRKANKISVTAYVASDRADDEEKQLRRACETKGAATLVLPMERLRAHCEDCSRDFNKDKQGYVAFSLKFVRDGLATGLAPIGYLSRLAEYTAGAIRVPLATAFLATFSTLRQPGFVVAGAVRTVQTMAAALEAARVGLPLDPEAEPGIKLAIQALHDDAETLARVGAVGDRIERTAYVAEAESATSAAIVERVGAIVTDLREQALDQAQAATALASLMQFSGDLPTVTILTASSRRQADNDAALAMLLEVAAAAEYAAAIAGVEHADRRSARQARADVAELIEDVLSRLAGPRAHEARLALVEVRDQAIAYLSQAIIDLAPVLAIEAHRALPALWWANRLYGDAGRAGELVARNRVVHAGFMPRAFEALAR